MKFSIDIKPIEKSTGDLLVLFSHSATPITSKFPSVADEVKSIQDKNGDMVVFHTHGKFPVPRIAIVGIDTKKCMLSDLLTVASKIGQKAREIKARSITVQLPSIAGLSVWQSVKSLVEGIELGTYEFTRHKNKKEQEKAIPINNVSIIVVKQNQKEAQQGMDQGVVANLATIFTRDLVNEPSSVTTPTYLSLVAMSLSHNNPDISCEILGKKDMEKLGMGGILGVAKGSNEEPKFIRLAYKAGAGKTIVLVGKGITFDSGGLSLKPGKSMETMKMDMAGAATVLGIFSVLSQLKPKVNVVGLIAACENMPSGGAIKPGDIVTALNGKTIEIINTDAEGRVILADALSYAVKYEKPDALIDIATLTGACMVALGEDIAGLFSNSESLSQSIQKSAKAAGESVWELPLASQYRELIQGNVGDIKNSSGKKYGGAITAALFLQEFVPDTIAWAHLDIAGPAFEEKGKAITPYGATGFGVRTLLHFLTATK